MELPMGDRVYAAERIMKKRTRRVSTSVIFYCQNGIINKY